MTEKMGPTEEQECSRSTENSQFAIQLDLTNTLLEYRQQGLRDVEYEEYVVLADSPLLQQVVPKFDI